MLLLYLSLAYLIGILGGQLLWQAGGLGCGLPPYLWCAPLLLTVLLGILQRLRPRATPPIIMVWPTAAGFEPPSTGLPPAAYLALLFCCCAGLLRYASQPLTPCWQPDDLAYYNQAADRAFDRDTPAVTVTGYVSSYPLVKALRQRLQVTVQQLQQNGNIYSVQGELRLTTDTEQPYSYGQPLLLRGKLVTPPDFEDFSYREYLARKGVHSLFYAETIEPLAGPNQGAGYLQLLYAFRARGAAVLNRLLPEPYAALANGMLLGIEAGIPDALYEQFNLTGTSHVIVISGSNVALIAGVLMALGQRLVGRRRALWPTLVGIGAYALLVGGDAAVLRAAWMGALYVIATSLERRSTALVSLAFACWLLTLANPLTLWDVGFQLSSAATAGLILFSPGVNNFFSRLWPTLFGTKTLESTLQIGGVDLLGRGRSLLQGLLQDGLLVTIAANLTTLPLVLYYFGRLSIVSLLTNLLIAPAQSLIMLWGSAGLLLGVSGLLLPAQLVLWIPWLCLAWTVGVVQWTAALPYASLELTNYGLDKLLLTYLCMAAVTLRKQWGVGLRTLLGNGLQQGMRAVIGPTAVSALVLCATLVWALALTQPDGRLHLYFLNIGQGDGILLQTPSGRQVLIDGGADPQRLMQELGAVMPFWDRSLDLVILTNPDRDHMDAQAQTTTRLQLTTALETQASQANHDADDWRANLAAAHVEIQRQHQGGWIDVGDGVALWVLWPPSTPFLVDQSNEEQVIDNENSLIIKLVYDDFSALLTGDAGLPSEEELLTTSIPLAATVLKVGHHGSKGSSGEAFVAAVAPQIAVIQVGAENEYGHPHPEALARLAHALVLRNDLHGRIHLASDGQQLWIETEQPYSAPPSSALAMP